MRFYFVLVLVLGLRVLVLVLVLAPLVLVLVLDDIVYLLKDCSLSAASLLVFRVRPQTYLQLLLHPTFTICLRSAACHFGHFSHSIFTYLLQLPT